MGNLVYKVQLDIKNGLNNAISSIKKQLSDVKVEAGKTNSSFMKFTSLCQKMNTIHFNAVVDATRNVTDAFSTLSASGIGFEKSMADLSSITGIAGKDLDNLGKIARQTGKDSGLGAAGATDAFALLASQIQVDKIGMEGLVTLQKETITLAQAGGMNMTDSATALAATINQFGLEATEANRVINVLAAGSKYGAAEITDLSQSFKVTGAVAAAAGLSVEQTAGAIEVLSKNNLKGSEAGTALRNVLVKMQTALKVDFTKVGLSTALDGLKPKLNDVTFLAKTFGSENLAAAQFLIKNAAAVDEMTTAVTGTNVAQEQSAISMNTTAEQMKRMQASIDDVKIRFFQVTGGVSAYMSALGESMVMISQMYPLLGTLGRSISSVTGLIKLKTIAVGIGGIATKASAAATSIYISSQFALGVVLSMARTRFVALTGALTLHNVATKASAAATVVMSAAAAALNAVMSANPIMMIVLAISALVAGIVLAYKNFEGFRRVVDGAWEGVKKLTSSIWNGLAKAFGKISSAIAIVWGKLKYLLGIEDDVVLSTTEVTVATEDLADANTGGASAIDIFSGALEGQNKKLNTNLGTIGGVEQKISALRTAQKSAMDEQAIALEKEIRLWEKKQEAMKNAISIGAATPPELKPLDAPANKGIDLKGAKATNPKVDEQGKLTLPDSGSLNKLTENIDTAQRKTLSFNESIWGTNSTIGQWADNATASITRISTIFQEFGGMLKNKTLNTVQQVSGSLQAMGAMMGAMGGIVDGAAGSWLNWGANVLAMIAQAIPLIMALATTQVTAATAQVTANTAVAATGAAASVASIPVVGWIMAGVAVAGVIAALAAVPKPKLPAFANGGIVYGNTFAQVGEYPGAANNPEVIAPLSKLKSMLSPQGFSGGTVEFVIKGNRLIGVMNKENDKGRYF